MRILAFVSISALALLMINCGGSGSSSATNKIPIISSLSPSSATVGSSSFTVTATGLNFSSGCVASWSGSQRSSTYVNSTVLTFRVLAGDVSSTGVSSISISCNNKFSNSMDFAVINPAPAVTSASPSSATAGGNSFSLTINGSNFLPSSSVRWNSIERSKIYVSSSALTIPVTYTDISTAGTVNITVANPSPGGGTSSTFAFQINPLQPLSVATRNLPDAFNGKHYYYTLQGAGGVQPYRWALESGALPSKISFDAMNGIINGSPAAAGDSLSNFAIRLFDSAYQPSSVLQNLSIRVHSSSLGRNDTCATATPISNGTIRASISPFGDIDVYSFQGTQYSTVRIEVFARRLSEENYMDSLLELLDSNCIKLSYNDDIDLGIITDSLIGYTLPSTGKYYIRVSDLRGDGRPDFVYNLSLSGAD